MIDTGYSLTFNIYSGTKDAQTGHVNVTFRSPGADPVRIGQNINSDDDTPVNQIDPFSATLDGIV